MTGGGYGRYLQIPTFLRRGMKMVMGKLKHVRIVVADHAREDGIFQKRPRLIDEVLPASP